MSNNISNQRYLKFVRTLKCCHCQTYGVDAHHVIGLKMGMMGGKADDIHSVPLCREHHTEVHKNPTAWPQFAWILETQHRAVKAGYL